MNRYVVATLACFGVFAVYIAICLAVGGTNHFLVAGLMVAVAGTWVAIVKSMHPSRRNQGPPPIIESLPKQKLSVHIPMTPAAPPAYERRDVHKTKRNTDTLLRVVLAVVWGAVGVVVFINGYLEGDVGPIMYCLLFPVPLVFLLFWKKRGKAFALVMLGFVLWGGVILVRGAIVRVSAMWGLKNCVAGTEAIITLEQKPSTQATTDAPQLSTGAMGALSSLISSMQEMSRPITPLGTATLPAPQQRADLHRWLDNALQMARRIKDSQSRGDTFLAVARTQFQCGDVDAAFQTAEEASRDAEARRWKRGWEWDQLLDIARLQASMGNLTAARQTVLRYIERASREKYASALLEDALKCQLVIGDTNGAAVTAAFVKNGKGVIESWNNDWNIERQSLDSRTIAFGDDSAAAVQAIRAADESNWIYSMCEVIQQLVANGQPQKALKHFNEMLPILSSEMNLWPIGNAYESLATFYAQQLDTNTVRTLTQNVVAKIGYTETFASAPMVVAEFSPELIEPTLSEINAELATAPDRSGFLRLWVLLVGIQMRAGDKDAAARAIGILENIAAATEAESTQKYDTLNYLATAYDLVGRRDDALETLNKAVNIYASIPFWETVIVGSYDFPFDEFAQTYARLGMPKEAEKFYIKAAKEDNEWTSVIRFYTDRGDFDKAIGVALRKIDEPKQRAAVLRSIARYQTQNRSPEELKSWFRKLSNPMDATYAFLGAAEGLHARYSQSPIAKSK